MFAQASRRLSSGFIVLCACYGAVVCQPDSSCTTPEGSPGSCIARTSCSYVSNLIQNAPKPLSAENQRLFLNYRCDARAKLPKVCCPVTPSPLFVAGHRNLRLLPASCGDVEEDKLHGGNKTGLYEYPFMTLIASDEDGQRRFTCAGAVINSRYILTAAHCITNLGGKVLAGVRVGEHDYSTDVDCEMVGIDRRECAPPVQDFLIEKIITHKDYVGKRAGGNFQLQHDIGLIRVRGQIDLTKPNASPVCLPTTRRLQEYNLDGEILVLPGWGVTEKRKDGSPELLQIFVPVVSNQDCGNIYNRSIADGVGFRQLCAGGEKGISSCNADSGGPLLFPVTVDVSRYVQYGIVSGGTTRCGLRGAPAIYTRVAFYMDWILDNLEP